MSELVVITGDRGFVGSRLRERCLSLGYRVLGLSRSSVDVGDPNYEHVQVDLSNRASTSHLGDSIRSASAVFHVAAELPRTDDDPLAPHIAANLRSTENLIDVLSGSTTPLILSSTMSVFGLPPAIPVREDQAPRPIEAYGMTKLVAEHACERAARRGELKAIVLRYPGIFGIGYDYGAINFYAREALAGREVSVYGHGKTIRDYVHVDDVVDANLLAEQATIDRNWGLYHIGGGCPLRLRDLAELTTKIVGSGSVTTNASPAPFDFAFDITQSQSDLGYVPRPLAERIEQYVRAFRDMDMSAE